MQSWPKSIRNLLFTFLFISSTCLSQELNFTVSINADAVQTTERAIFTEMEESFGEFLNERKWTNDDFKKNEKIKGNLIITIKSQPSIGTFKANAQVQVVRPVYNSSYETLLFNFADRSWDFNYTPSVPMEFNENSFSSNLTSLLAFYAYIAIGLDYDSFSPLGGTSYYQKALDIVNNAQQQETAGWKAFESTRNRYWLTENLMINKQYEPVRLAVYTYHLEGLDIFESTPEKSRKNILDALRELQKVNRTLPNSILIRAFMDAKSDEIVNIYSDGPINVRRDTYNELLKLDPNNSADYRKIIAN